MQNGSCLRDGRPVHLLYVVHCSFFGVVNTVALHGNWRGKLSRTGPIIRFAHTCVDQTLPKENLFTCTFLMHIDFRATFVISSGGW